MSLIVQLNTRASGRAIGAWNQNLSYYDPLTGVNLRPGNLQSADLSSFSSAQLVNIAEAVYAGVLSVVVGATALPAATAYSTYSDFVSAGSAGSPGWYGITGVAQAEF